MPEQFGDMAHHARKPPTMFAVTQSQLTKDRLHWFVGNQWKLEPMPPMPPAQLLQPGRPEASTAMAKDQVKEQGLALGAAAQTDKVPQVRSPQPWMDSQAAQRCSPLERLLRLN